MASEWDEFRGVFFEEAAEHLSAMESGLLELETSADCTDVLNRLFRAAHSVKGASATLGMEGLASFSHSLEELLGRLRDGLVQLHPSHIDLLLRAKDMLAALVAAERDNAPSPADLDAVVQELRRACQAGTPVPNQSMGQSSSGVTDALSPACMRVPKPEAPEGPATSTPQHDAAFATEAPWLLALAERLVETYQHMEHAVVELETGA